jgi:hypothetical protein
MKKSITRIMAALALLVTLAIPMGVWGQTSVTWPGTTALPGTATAVANDQNVTIMVSATNTYSNPIRIYANTTVTINALNNAKILSVAYEASSTGNYVTYAQNATVVPDVTPTVSGKIVTWTYAESANVTEFTFKPSSQTRCNGITITYIMPGTGPTVATPTFSPVGGTYPETQTVSISCETQGTTIYYTLDGSTPDDESIQYSTPITVSETKTIKAIAYDSNDNTSNVASATYTIVTPMTIAEVRAQQTGDVVTAGTVTSCVGTTGYIQDATAAICVYGASLTVGDNISVSGTLSTFHGLLEITNPQVTVISQGNTVNPEVMTIAQAVSSTNQGWYIRIEDATVTEIDGQNTTIAQGENTIVVRGISGVEYDVNDVISLNGNIGCYDGNQIANPQNVEVQAAPAVPSITITPDVVNVDAEEHDGTLDFTYENLTITDMTDFDIQYYDAEGEETETPNWIEVLVAEQDPEIGEGYVVSYYMFENEGEARSAYFKVFAAGDEDFVYSNLVTINQAEYVAPALDYAELPFEFDGTYNDIATTDGLIEEGLGNYSSAPHLKFDGSGDWLLLHFIEAPGTLTFVLKANPGSNGWSGTFTVQTSEDGETYTDLATYTDISTNGQSEEFTNLGENVRYIKWIYTEKVSGNVGLGNIALAEYVAPALVASITVNPDEVNVDAEEHDGTLDLTYENLTITDMTDFDIQFCDANGDELSEEPDWIEVLVAEQDPTIGEGYVVSYYMMENEGPDARTAYFKVYAMDDETNLVYSNLVTISQTAPATGDEYALYTGELVEGDYLIVYDGGAMNTTVTNDRLQYEDVTVNNDVIVTDNAAIVWHIAPSGQYWTIYNADADAYAASTGVKNKAQMLADGTDDKALWTVSGTETYEFVNKKNTANSVNANLRKNGTYGFACYATSTGGALSLYKKVAEPITETYPLDITGYEAGSDGGYYLIASPVTVNPASVEGMTTGEYDLYSFDQAEAEEWRNYKAGAFTNLEPGKGYLYAKQATTEGEVFHFELTGTPYNGEPIRLSKSENVDFPGWNLVGNPFGQTAYIDRDFYVMKSDGSEIIESETNEIDVMQGVFVIAANDGEGLTFSTEAPTTTDGKIVMNVSNARRSVVDRATVRFGEGRTLPKFMLNDENTKIYFTEGNEEFAVVRSINENLTPVSFHAAENGTYTLSINTENVDFSFFHLIDNMTGNDIDLLSTPSYTFEASTTDYAQRFSLLYATVDGVSENNAETFAFFNGNEWVVNNEGEANLQVIDMTGRLISSETVNGTVTVSLNQSAGIYMLRLVNGNNVKVQKVVVR